MFSWQSRRFIINKKGATAVEYGLIVSLIAAAIIASLSQIGQETNKPLNCLSNVMQGQDKATACP